MPEQDSISISEEKRSRHARPHWIYPWTFGVFVGSLLLGRWLGIRFADNGVEFLYQFLDPEILRNDLARGLYYLHVQPPLFNLFLGLVLKSFPGTATVAFAVSFAAISLGLLLGMVWLMRRLGVPALLAGASVLMFAWTPNFMVYSNWVFYTLPVAFLVQLSAILLMRYLETGRSVLAHAFSWSGALLMLTRALYHPLWFMAVVASVSAFVKTQKRKELLVSAIVPLLLVNGLYLKNYLQVGSYSGSSWLGMNLSKRWPLSQSEMAALREDGTLPPVWHRRPFREPDELRHLGYFRPRPGVHPAIGAPYKSNGQPNFNHRDYASISQEMERADRYLILHYPGRYLQRTATAFLLYLQPGPNSVDFLVDYDFSRVHRLRDVLTRTLFRGGPIERPIGMFEPPANLWVLGFPALLAFGLYSTLRGNPSDRRDPRPVFAYMVVTIVWVTVTSSLIEIGENDRMRWEVEPLLTVLLATAATAVYRRLIAFGAAGRV